MQVRTLSSPNEEVWYDILHKFPLQLGLHIIMIFLLNFANNTFSIFRWLVVDRGMAMEIMNHGETKGLKTINGGLNEFSFLKPCPNF